MLKYKPEAPGWMLRYKEYTTYRSEPRAVRHRAIAGPAAYQEIEWIVAGGL